MTGHNVHVTKFSTDIDRFQTVAENLELTKTDLRVFIFLSCRVGSKYYVRVDKSQIAESLCLSKKKVSDSLCNLELQGIIEKGGDEHTKEGYRMSYTNT